MKITILYKFRRALALGAIAGGALVACSKGNVSPTRDVNMNFYGKKAMDIESIKQYAKMPNIQHIYIIPTGDFEIYSAGYVQKAREYLEEDIIPIAPTKISGNGKDGFKFGRGCVTPIDSLWYEQHGWPVNRNTKQR